MTELSREEGLRIAKECGFDLHDELERFSAAIYEAGAKSERAVSDRLLDALKRVIGSHFAPNDCYATGPLTGNYHQDFVECPSCTGEDLIAEVEALRKEKPE